MPGRKHFPGLNLKEDQQRQLSIRRRAPSSRPKQSLKRKLKQSLTSIFDEIMLWNRRRARPPLFVLHGDHQLAPCVRPVADLLGPAFRAGILLRVDHHMPTNAYVQRGPHTQALQDLRECCDWLLSTWVS